MAKAKKLPSGNWRVQVFSHKDSNGRNRYESFTAPTKREAELKAASFAANRNRMQVSDYTVIEAITGYIDIKGKVLSPSTIKGYMAMVENYTPIKDIRISRLDNKTVQRFINDLAESSSPKYIRNIYSLLCSAVKMYENISFNVTLPAKAKRLKKAPSDEDVKLLYSNSKGNLKKAIYLGMLGMRRGEICALEYSDIENGMAHIHKDMVKGKDGWIIKNIPKTSESERYVQLPKGFSDIIGEGEGRIIEYRPNSVTDAFHDLALKNGKNLHFHDLRHYFASTAHAMGIPDQYIMVMGGWKTDRVLKAIYRNSIDSIEKKYRSEYAEKISSLV